MTDLKQNIESLSEAVAKLGYISNSCPCNDAGLKLILEEITHDLLQIHHFLDFHTDEGILQWRSNDNETNQS